MVYARIKEMIGGRWLYFVGASREGILRATANGTDFGWPLSGQIEFIDSERVLAAVSRKPLQQPDGTSRLDMLNHGVTAARRGDECFYLFSDDA